MVTRRVAQRVFLLTPSTVSRQVVEYCFARALQLHPGIELHNLEVLSNHFHAVLTDRDDSLPSFMAWVDREIAKALNELFDRDEALWSSDHYSRVELEDSAAVFDKCSYVFVNVVKAGLVRDFRQWPGVRSEPLDWLRAPKTVHRPSFYFGQKDERWATAELRFTIPPQFRDRDPEQVVRDFNREIEDRQRTYREQARRDGKAFLGADRVLKQSPFDRPKTPTTKGNLNPTFAAGTPEGHKRAREKRKAFLSAYRQALADLRKGIRALFPAGAYLWPRLCALPCAPLQTASCSVDSG